MSTHGLYDAAFTMVKGESGVQFDGLTKLEYATIHITAGLYASGNTLSSKSITSIAHHAAIACLQQE